MSGKRQRSFRRGDLSEELGILLLKEIAAVASVPRPEDFGLDAIATLLRPMGDHFLAEDGFYLQMKSESVRELAFEGHEVRWLEELRLPLFIGIVSKRNASISLYPCHHLTEFLLQPSVERVTLIPGPEQKGKRPHGAIYLGPPILEWSTSDIDSVEFQRNAYEVLKQYIQAEHQNLQLRKSRFCWLLEWETGKPTLRRRGHMIQGRFSEHLQEVLRGMIPGLHFVVSASGFGRYPEALKLCQAFREYMGAHGVPFDEAGFIDAMIRAYE
jgi:hypothetical protein